LQRDTSTQIVCWTSYSRRQGCDRIVNIIVVGVIGRQPLPGQVWYWLHHLLGLRRLGHDVVFLEECGDFPYAYDFEAMEESHDARRAAAKVDEILGRFGLGDRWALRAGSECYGLACDDFVAFCHDADVLIVPPTALWQWRREYDAPPVRIFLDGDPGFTQLRALAGDWPIPETIERCNRHFTYGTAIATGAGPLPTLGLEWRFTRPPIVLDEWPVAPPVEGARYTTVMHWSLDASPEWEGETYGQKDEEFERIIDLPRRTRTPLEVALNDGPFERLEAHGWHVVSRPPTDVDAYRDYVRRSRGELSVAKAGYVKARSGWMSERTNCFLASGRPALVQETGLSDWVPTGRGLLTYSSPDEAVEGLEELEREYEHHARAARHVAEAFDSDRVLTDLLAAAGAGA
jgi:hypothetical protein